MSTGDHSAGEPKRTTTTSQIANRPRPDANQTGAGSPNTHLGAREESSMTENSSWRSHLARHSPYGGCVRSSATAECARCGGAGWVWLHATGPGGLVRAAEASCPDCCGPSLTDVLDWREAHHWSPRAMPCSYCGGMTNLRDDDGRPAHKSCAANAVEPAAAPEIGGGAG
jgi:hypothetical protein